MKILQRLHRLFAASGMCPLLTNKRYKSLVVLLLLVTLFLVTQPPAPVELGGETVPTSSQEAVKVTDPYSEIKKGDVTWLNTPEDFFLRLENEKGQTHCKKMVKAGGTSCRGIRLSIKYICLDDDVALHPRDCVAYSFGIANEISFDNKIARFGCQVYMMDPSVRPFGKYNHLTGKQKFFDVGISNTDRMNPYSYEDPETFEEVLSNITFLTYSSIHDITGYRGPVHYLKIDIEGGEWQSLEYIMDNNLLVGTQQIMVEIHLLEVLKMKNMEDLMKILKEKWLFLERLEDHGFLRVLYDATPSVFVYEVPGTNRTKNFCGELFLIRKQRLI